MGKRDAFSDLQTIPGVGAAMERDFLSLGITSVAELRDKDPQELYDRLCSLTGKHQDRCVLYVFREAVAFAKASPEERSAKQFRWWDFKD